METVEKIWLRLTVDSYLDYRKVINILQTDTGSEEAYFFHLYDEHSVVCTYSSSNKNTVLFGENEVIPITVLRKYTPKDEEQHHLLEISFGGKIIGFMFVSKFHFEEPVRKHIVMSLGIGVYINYLKESKVHLLRFMSSELKDAMDEIALKIPTLLAASSDDANEETFATQRSFYRLFSTVNNMTALSKLESNAVALSEVLFNPRSCIRQTIDIVTTSHPHLGISLNAPDGDRGGLPTMLIGDRKKLQNLLINLFVALDTPTHVNLVVSASYSTQQEELNLKISSEDAGLEDRLLDMDCPIHSSDVFFGSASSSRNSLSMAVSSHLVELMNGEISLENDCIQLVIPFKVAESGDESDKMIFTGKTVLVIGDSGGESHHSLFETLFRWNCFAISPTSVNDLDLYLRKIASIHLIILQHSASVSLDVINRIRQSGVTTPILVLLTSDMLRRLPKKFLALADGWLPSPYTAETLKNKCRDLLLI